MPVTEVIGYYFCHQQCDFVWRVEFSCLFACVCCEVADEVFVDESEYVVVLGIICRDVFDEFEQFEDCFGACAVCLAEFAQTGLESIEYFVEDSVVSLVYVPFEGKKGVRDLRCVKLRTGSNPYRE